MKLWGKIWKDNHLLRDVTAIDDTSDTRTHRIFHALEEICITLDLPRPIWLDSNISEFKRHKHVKFRQDSFIEEIDFDYLEIQVLEE